MQRLRTPQPTITALIAKHRWRSTREAVRGNLDEDSAGSSY